MAETTQETLEQKVARLEVEAAAKDAIIAGQAEQLQVAEASASAGRTVVTHNKKQYSVLAQAFTFEGEKITAEQLKDKADVVKKLVDSKSGVLQLLTKEEAAEAADAK